MRDTRVRFLAKTHAWSWNEIVPAKSRAEGQVHGLDRHVPNMDAHLAFIF
jgi:hypothetical protein